VFAPAELKQELAKWSGRRVFIDYQIDVDGPQTAARLINEVFASVGILVKGVDTDAEAYIWIQAAAPGRFAFAVLSPTNPNSRLANVCGPTELTAAVMRTVGSFFDQYCLTSSPGTPNRSAVASERGRADLTEKVDSLLAEIDLRGSAIAEVTLAEMGEEVVDHLIPSTIQVNRLICASLLSGDTDPLRGHLKSFADRLRLLGATHSPRAVRTLLNALADSAQTASSGLPGAQQVVESAVTALVSIGDPALPELKKHVGHPNIAVREAIARVVGQIEVR
jgi:hypothetical protein